MTNEELIALLEKAQITTSLGGQASAQDATEFIDLAVDQTEVLKRIRVESGIKTSYNIDGIALGAPVTVSATEATAPVSGDVNTPTITRATLQPIEVIAPFDVSFSFLRKNIEGERVNDTLNKLFAKRFGKDMVMLAFNGDDSNTGTSRVDKLLKIKDGFYVQAAADVNVHSVTISGADYLSTIFPNMLAALPKDYKDDREQLGLFVSPDVAEAYAQQIGARNTSLGDQILTGIALPRFRGIEVIPVYGNDDAKMVLTPKSNLVVGFGQEMTIGRDVYNRRRIVEVTITAEVDMKYAVSDALVYGHA